jgi:hypothetical protein
LHCSFPDTLLTLQTEFSQQRRFGASAWYWIQAKDDAAPEKEVFNHNHLNCQEVNCKLTTFRSKSAAYDAEHQGSFQQFDFVFNPTDDDSGPAPL